MKLTHRREIPCQLVVELITDYHEVALSIRERRRFEHHLAGCPHCTAYLAQMRDTVRLTGRLVPNDVSDDMQLEFRALYRKWQSGT